MGLFKLGGLIRFIPVAVVIGFTNGIAVLIALTQIKDFLGLSITAMLADFVGIVLALSAALHTLNLKALWLGLSSLAIIIAWPAFSWDSVRFLLVPPSHSRCWGPSSRCCAHAWPTA